MSSNSDPAALDEKMGDEVPASYIVEADTALHSKEHLDAGGKWLAEVALRPDAAELMAPWTPEEERAVVRKADWIVLPLLMWATIIGSTDKLALGSAAVLGIRTDLGLVGTQYSWTSSLIYFGQLPAVLPALFILQRYHSGFVFGGNILIWGFLTLCMAGTKNFGGLASLRFLLGFFEALTLPALNIFVAAWYTRKEQISRTAIVYGMIASVVNGLIAYGASFISKTSKLHPWQVQFLTLGAFTFCFGVLCIFCLPDTPVAARFLTPRQRTIAVLRLKGNNTGMENSSINVAQIKETMLDFKTYLLFLINLCLALPNAGINTFAALIISGLGYTTRQSLLLNVPGGVISWIATGLFAYITVKTGKRCLFTAISCLVPLLATILLHVLPRSNKQGLLGAVYLVFFYWPPYLLMTIVSMANTAGRTKKTMTYGVGYCGYLVGSIVGPLCFKTAEAPAYQSGVMALLICYCCAIVLVAIYFVNLVYLNRNNRKYLQAHPEQETEDGLLTEWHDQSDRANRKFVYLY